VNQLITLFLAIITAASGNLVLKFGMLRFGKLTLEKTAIISELFKLFTSPIILIGLFLYGLSFIFWVKVLSTEELGRVYPIVVASTITLILLASVIFFKETISTARIIGILVIIIGIYLVFRT
jgi:multidrug transporter EmrE-like cation transporter